MRNVITIIIALLLSTSLLNACSKGQTDPESDPQSESAAYPVPDESSVPVSSQISEDGSSEQQSEFSAVSSDTSAVKEEKELKLVIDSTPLSVKWEDNSSVEYLKELCRDKPLTIQMSMYGGFEQVGSIGAQVPRNDIQMTTSPGDIVLYSGSQMVVFYGSNSWAYTKLGHITDRSPEEISELLSGGDVTIKLSI